jgi:hypothetical protein
MSLPWYLTGAFALGCAGLGLWNWSQSATIDAKEATIKERDATIVLKDQQIAQSQTNDEQNKSTISTLRAERDAASTIAAKFDQLARARDARFFSILEKVTNGPANEDGPVPRVLEHALDSLREGSAGADRPDADAGRTDPAPEGEAALSGGKADPAPKACRGDDVCLVRRGFPPTP